VVKKTSILLLPILALLLAQCDAPTRGCLDIEATNFEFTADKPCEDECCKYPNLIVVINQEYVDSVFKENKAYKNDLNQWFRIKSAAFYLSDFKLQQQGTLYQISDSLRTSVFGVAATDTLAKVFLNDVVLARRIPLEYTVGTFKKSGFFDQIDFKIGLDAPQNGIIPRKTPSGHPLNKQTDSLWLSRSEGFVWMQIVVAKDSAAATIADTLRFTSTDFGATPKLFQKTGNFEHKTGFDFKVGLKIDFAELVKGVDFANTGKDKWKIKMVSNLNSTFDVQ
jgi:hypothetical protein